MNPNPTHKFAKGNPGRKKGSKNKKTIAFERVYQRCCNVGFHPADVLIEICRDSATPADLRIETCLDLLTFMEGRQPESRPVVPQSPGDSVKSAEERLKNLAKLSEPLEPAAAIPDPKL